MRFEVTSFNPRERTRVYFALTCVMHLLGIATWKRKNSFFLFSLFFLEFFFLKRVSRLVTGYTLEIDFQW
jgi:hypothetical protein